jgi:hypothetical protein
MPTPIPSTQVALGLLSPKNYEDTYPVYDFRYGYGGFRTVGSTTDLLIPSGAGEAVDPLTPDRSITSLRRKKGMMVYVEGVTAFYGLFSSTADSSWEVVGPRYFKGGLRSLGTTAQMEAIRDDMREEGMVVYVSGVTAYYALIGTTANSGWTTGFTFGSGGGGGGGGIVGDYVTTFNGLSGAVQGVSAAIAGDGITLSAATGSVTITNIGVLSFNGRTGAVTGASLGANVFDGLNTFNAGITTAFLYASTGSTFGGTLQVNGGATFAGRVDIGGVLDVVNGATFESTTDHAGVARFAAGITTTTLDASGAARFNGGLTASAVDVTGLARFAGGITAAGATLGTLVVNNGISAAGGITLNGVVNVSSGVTFSSTTDHTGLARFTGGITTAFLYASTGSTFGGTLQVNGGATFAGRVDIGGILDVVSGATFEQTTDHGGVARFSAGITTTTIDVSGAARFNGGLTASRIDVTGNGNVVGDFTVGATLNVNGNLYVQGTVTTVNETQLLIQDKYLVLGSTLGNDSLNGTSAGVYIGTTTSPIASFAYNDNLKSWDSNRNINIAGGTAYYIGGTEVLSGQTLGSGVVNSSLTRVGTLVAGTWNASVIGLTYGGTNKDLSAVGASGGVVFKDGTGLSITSAGTNGQILRADSNGAPAWVNLTALTGITATSVNITDTGDSSATYRITMIDSSGFGAKLVYADAGITFDALTNTLSCSKLEAMVDGGTW